ncbi:alpha-amylase family protein [Shewanella sp. 1_MG-2023]|uniref:alpha-amylase family protein n=1 Tax=unclassified Shewanella TaxID=196818 RepID=UPI0026E273F5|nr:MULTISPECIES: alpha-amylase family protein [unclassified Shewanella]MDO6611013.1 alpha-amylase family protein [Shewanella sp. 7_MG-2023]MDO6770136.1 alpha-amylase family protein [Shewanella sp. 2_MG-2023]MDO6794752.1 alpha-amylase family protein [Shewanella sp. 1_MG-2023]
MSTLLPSISLLQNTNALTNKKSSIIRLSMCAAALFMVGCTKQTPVENSLMESSSSAKTEKELMSEPLTGKPVVYQVFTRLYGNTNTTNKPWGTIAENGVGKFSDFTDIALQDIKSLGTTHLWYTGIPHHALINDYTEFGISNDDPDVVKGRAGSPYAVKDYYNVNPDLADNPQQRLAEFEALIKRTHDNGMQVIIDIVPNHVARDYQSLDANDPTQAALLPKNRQFGQNDNTQVEYDKNNNFYYVVDSEFAVPDAINGYQPLGGEQHPLADGMFEEKPAKWTGNGSRLAKPHANDWYETVKVNYGVKPDGSYDFPALPEHFADKSVTEHYAFWQSQNAAEIPDSWIKFKDITQYWLAKGVDGFRYDMAEMVPVEFWSYLNSNIKHINPNAFLLAEVYNPSLYRDFIHLGKMDYLYDKVDLYDTLKDIIHRKTSTAQIAVDQEKVMDIEQHMLHFLENHDEQRIHTDDFAGTSEAALPAMVVSTTISRSPTLIYFGQDVGEQGAENAGFGQATRTSIFDYVGVPAHQRWMNNGAFDGGQSSASEKSLRLYYQTLLNLSHTAPALTGEYYELDSINRLSEQAENEVNSSTDSLNANININANNQYNDSTFAFSRYNDEQFIIVVTNFSSSDKASFTLSLPTELISAAKLTAAQYQLVDLLDDKKQSQQLSINQAAAGTISIKLNPLESQVLAVDL